MEENKNNINYKINTELLRDYLEAVIGDEMILNSFIRDIEITSKKGSKVTIAVSSVQAMEIIKDQYFKTFEDALKNIYNEKSIDVFLTLDKDWSADNVKIESKGLSPKYTFDNYVNCDFNVEAVKMGKSVIKNPGKYSPLFINSKSGLGKTHLLHSIGRELDKKGYSVMYVEPNQFTKKIVEFSKMGGDAITKYTESLMQYDVLIFDDIQNLGDRSVTLRVLFQIHNTFIENNKQILIASDKSPNELTGFESRFITRFDSGLKTSINQPSIECLIKILEFKLKKEKLSPEKWEKEALQFIARNNSSSIRSIEGAVKRVSFFIEDEYNIKYTYTVIHNIFKKLTIDADELTPSRIITVVASYYKINKSNITGSSRKANIAIARHMAIWMIRKILDLPYKDIGKIFGGRDHSTIISSIRTIDKKMEINNLLKQAAEKIENNIKSIN